MSADDFRAYLNEQSQAQAAMQRLADISRDPEDEAADVADAVERSARTEVSAIADRADEIEEDLIDVTSETRSLLDQINDGSMTAMDARKALADLRQRHGRTLNSIATLKPRYESAIKTVQDPAARRDELIARYGL